VTIMPVNNTLIINAQWNPMWFIYKTLYIHNLQKVKMFQVKLFWQ
jgi:hypothetical protein